MRAAHRAGQPIEDQLVGWLHTFQPDERLRKLILDTINAEATDHGNDGPARRRELLTARAAARPLPHGRPHEGPVRHAPPSDRGRAAARQAADPDLDRPQALLEDFARFWETEPDPAERRKLLNALFDHIWQKDGTIVAVKPQAPFARYFTAANQSQTKPPKGDRKSGMTKAGATGVGSGLYPQAARWIEVWVEPPLTT